MNFRQQTSSWRASSPDWAYFADPDNATVRQIASAIYIARIEAESTPTQEALVYLDHLAELHTDD